MKLRKTITFEPDDDVLTQLLEVDRRGRGVRSRLINQAIRSQLSHALRNWDALFAAPKSEVSGTR